MTTYSLYTELEEQDIVKSNFPPLNLPIGQETIYDFLMEVVNQRSVEDVLQEFKRLFFGFSESGSFKTMPVIRRILLANNEQEFHNTIKRCCYIVVNNWASKRKYDTIQELINLLANYEIFFQKTSYKSLHIYKQWLGNFINSDDYQELKLFATRHDSHSKVHWANRYAAYLLVAQSLNADNPKEQQEAASKLSKQIKDKFKFDLAIYIARSQSAASSNTRYKNPSILGEDVLRLIKLIIVKKGLFSYENIANIFIKQTHNQTFKDFKKSIRKYLFFSVDNLDLVKILNQYLKENLSAWKPEYDEEILDKNLFLRSCNRLIDCLTTENGREPSRLFVLLLSHGHPLTLVIILLKIILICPNSRNHLEIRIAHLIRYYEKFPEGECKSVINFIEIFNITFAIYAENIEYNLIKVNEDGSNYDSESYIDAYHVFSQIKENVLK
ncbi:hypothetical protein H6G76_01810 [Nostoc sp. FACHB-152]|uniref:hypothetical protein n=1 Tax=unclassified Nostoc TaxID=2593658 RepID=UPI001684C5F1|nr:MULTISPECIES: hypothetical protein [unclassified Nostoc]MBD2445908.1 hypothetical protein [Nostoc sp. FACHB-152]MBD2467916.1 hypothetical protein [Nostoc sp. FACHB-145]